jgi:Cu-Zn family superoxide dismutase
MRSIGIAALIALAAGSTLAQDKPGATAMFVDAAGEPSGSAALTQTADGVLIDIEVRGLPANQWVALHVHETGSCDPATGHESAGGHFNPTSSEHGYRAAAGPHAGDMPNQHVGSDGVLQAQVFNTMISLDDGETAILGRALMVHAEADDYESQPSGAAGDRLACGVIE